MATPKHFLKDGYSLAGRDILPVVMRLSELEGIPDEELASVSKKFPLLAYGAEDVAREVKKLTGYDVTKLLELARKEDDIGNRRLALHAAVLQANAVGAPQGQALVNKEPVAGTSTGSQFKRKADDSDGGPGAADAATAKRPVETGPEKGDRLGLLEAELKKIRSEQEGGNVENALNQILRTMTSKKVVFDGDITFCPECGTIMPNPGLADVVTCNNCKFQVDVMEYDGVEIRSKVVFNKRKTQTSSILEEEEETSKGPIVDRQCSKCGNEGMTFSTRQTRGADEGQTVFFSCPRCGLQESEFS